MKVVKTFEIVRKFLGWSYQEVSVKSGKYNPEYLKQVHQGRPFPGVEKDLIMTYMRGLAERAVYLASGGQVQGGLCDKFVAKFMQIVHRNNLSLGDAMKLVERVSKDRALTAKLRTQAMDVNVSIDIVWEEFLEEIVRGLNRPGQGKLLESDYVDTEVIPAFSPIEGSKYRLESSLSPSVPVLKLPQSRSQRAQYVQCPRCPSEQLWYLDCKCLNCGYPDIFSLN